MADEVLMAYADGELEATQLAAVEAAIAADPELARRVDQHRALRRRFRATFDETLAEPVPEKLLAAASGTASISDLQQARERKAARSENRARRWGGLEWGAIAASLAVGALIAVLTLRARSPDRFEQLDGKLLAQADLRQALDEQLASDAPAGARVRVGVSFKSRSGEYCRSFVVSEQSASGGLACRDGAGWRVDVLASTVAAPSVEGGYALAGAAMPAAVLEAIDRSIEGEPLDAAQELAARSQGWN